MNIHYEDMIFFTQTLVALTSFMMRQINNLANTNQYDATGKNAIL